MGDTLLNQNMLPSPETTRALRDALGRFVTGVTVITTQTDDGPVGFTANSFASVSLDPPLVLWSPAKSSVRFPIFSAAQSFSIHVLETSQADIATRFSRGGIGFDHLDHTYSAEGVPLIADALARFDCHQHATHDGGDHLIIVGRVIRFALRDGAPLVFGQGGYGAFTPNA
jgi:flavin reductase (DIM6/NTAB) family NADH-FMN oxidoreductase RutF